MKVADINTDHLRLSGGAKKAGPLLAGIGALLLGISAALSSGEWTTFWKSYLFGWMVAVGAAQPVGQLFNTITNGVRTMSGYASQIPVADRWAIIAYIRALQLSQNADASTVPNADSLPRVDEGNVR